MDVWLTVAFSVGILGFISVLGFAVVYLTAVFIMTNWMTKQSGKGLGMVRLVGQFMGICTHDQNADLEETNSTDPSINAVKPEAGKQKAN